MINSPLPAIIHTTQKAPLERFLARQRTKRVRALVQGRTVLDFGCGAQAWAARELRPLCRRIDGVEPTVAPGVVHGIQVVNQLDQLKQRHYEVVIALAVFEHLHPQQLQQVLHQLHAITVPGALVVGTVPTPLARPILELLSYRLGLIDPSQIRDHKVYYDNLWLPEILHDIPWRLQCYYTFQLGMNSFFVLQKR
ncbi:MAG TPA: hypothetical protein DDY43_01785 [Synechococcales bacterium UBA10510]|nr:hypothetical protein [Synechococcales bacterium UBA10510]